MHALSLLELAATARQQEVRWHLAPLLARLDLRPAQAVHVADVLESYLDDRSQIVRVNALQALTDLARERHPHLLDRVELLLVHQLEHGRPAVRARCRHLLAELGRDDARASRR